MLRRQLALNAGHEAPRRVLMLCLAGICVLSVPVFCTRFLNDMDYYSLVSDKLWRGYLLYRDAIDTKPPLVFLHYTAIFKLFGRDNVAAVKLVTMACLFGSSLLVGAVYRELFPQSKRPDAAALLFVLASFSGWGEDFLSSNTEILANIFVLGGVWLMVKDDFGDRLADLLAAGVLIGVACLYRYQSGAAFAAYAFTLLGARSDFVRPIRRLAVLALGGLMPLAALLTFYGLSGNLASLLVLLRYQAFYVRAHELYWPHVLVQVAIILSGLGPIIVLAGAQVRSMVSRHLGKREWFALLFLVFSVLPFFAGGHYFAHYIVQGIPAFVLLATARLSSEPASPPARDGWFARHARVIILGNVALFWMINLGYYSTRPADPPVEQLTHFVRTHTDPDDAVYLWTQRSRILLEIDRTYATRFLSNEMLTGRGYGSRYRRASATADAARGASVPELWPSLLGDLETEKPRLIIDDAGERSNFTIDHYPELASFVSSYYEPGEDIDGFRVYLRKS